jgi:hypothetical protein
MGLGDMFSSIFGGGNSYQAAQSPMMGMPRPGETPEQFRRRQQQEYEAKNAGYERTLNQALRESQGVGRQQTGLSNDLRSRMNQNIDFGGANNSLEQQQKMIDSISAQARGEGPNPALDQLRMTTDANIRSQAGALASSRGLNPALAARQASMAGANMNQEAAGQAAIQSAQQQLGAQQLAGNLLGQRAGLQSQMSGMNAQQQQAYANLLAQALANQRSQGMQQQGLAAGQQGSYQDRLQNAWNAMNNINAGVAAQNANTSGQYGQGIMGGLSSGLAAMGLAEGGEVPYPEGHKKTDIVMAEFDKGKLKSSSGKKVTNPKQAIAIALSEQRKFEKMSKGGVSHETLDDFALEVAKRGAKMASGGIAQYQAFQSGDPLSAEISSADLNKGSQMMGAGMEKAGEGLGSFLKDKFASAAPIGGSPGLMGLQGGNSKFSIMGAPEGAGMFGASLGAVPPMSSGGKVSGRAEIKGDSEKNDKVPVLLSPGEVVIPRSAVQDPEEAHAFLDKILKKKVKHYGEILALNRMYGE